MIVTIPISIGELYDKISILEIKSDMLFNDREKANNVDYELRELCKIAENYPIDPGIYIRLSSMNKRIWDIEDGIRECEKDKHFKERFIDLARAVYLNNDERAEIKRQINIEYKSEIIEEKSYANYK